MDYSLPPAIAWLRAHASERFFLFLHGYDAHGQHPLDDVDPRAVAPDYRGPLDGSVAEQARYREQMLAAIEAPGDAASLRGALTADDGRFLRTVYDRKIEAADRRVGRFLDALRELGLLDRTLVVLLSDHGEEFLEHGALDHGHTLHEEQLHVPLLMRFPRAAGRRDVQAPVRTIDVFPTVFDALGLRGPASVDGQSLMPLVRGQPLDLNLYAETDYRLFVHHRMVRHGRWKLVLDLSDGQMQLFDLEADPGELRDRAADAPDALRPLQADLSRWMSTLATTPAAYRGRRDTPITVY
jgi:arylsulfatase A-like enzyme